jgi:hypothetical protein
LETTPPPKKKVDLIGREAVIGFAAIAACLILIIGLRVISRNSASAGRSIVVTIPTPVVTAAQGCTNFANYWTDPDGPGLPDSVVEGLSNCRKAADGTWFVPSGVNDKRLTSVPEIPAADNAAAEALETALTNQIAGLEGEIPSTLQSWLKQIYDPIPRAVTGNVKEGVSIGTTRGRYTRLIQSFLMGPSSQELADYVGWLMARKLQAYGALNSACQTRSDLAYLKTACAGLEGNLSVRFPPFPWDLENSLLMHEYIAQKLASGES